MKRAAVIAFTKNGAALGQRLMPLLEDWETELFVPERIWTENQTRQNTEQRKMSPMLPDSHTWLAGNWNGYQGFIFVSAVGIAVRLIAPCLKDKLTDPAVVALDEKAHFSISLVSGHVGGANRLAESIAELLNAMPVITTATDVGDKFAVDLFAKKNELYLSAQDRWAARDISAAILEGKPVGLYCEYEICGEIPKELTRIEEPGGKESRGKQPRGKECFSSCIVIRRTELPELSEIPGGMENGGIVLPLLPRDVVLGIGCKKGMPPERIGEAIREACECCGISAKRLAAIASIALKAEEPGIQEAASQLEVPFVTYPAECLSQIPAVSRESEFVRTVTGIGNVCERAAVYCVLQEQKGEESTCATPEELQKEIEILLPKTIYGGITLAAVRKKWSVHFE